MRIQATKTFTSTLNKAIKNNYCIDKLELIKIPLDRAYITVGGGYSDRDIDFKTKEVKVIRIQYRPECYALPRYATTGDLNRLVRGLSELTIEAYTTAFLDAYTI